MAMSDAQIRAAKPSEKLYKLSDDGGLQLWIFPDGAKRWRMAYRFQGKQKTIAFGVYPTIGLKDARDLRQKAKVLLADGRDPSFEKKLDKVANEIAAGHTLNAIADELIAKKEREEKSPATIKKTTWLLSLVREHLGERPIAQMKAAEILTVLRKVEMRGRLETANRLRAVIGEVFRYAVATSRAENDPTVALRGALASPVVTHRAAIIDPKEFGQLLKVLGGYKGAPETVLALQLMPLTFTRPGELRAAEWSEFDFENAVWVIPAKKDENEARAQGAAVPSIASHFGNVEGLHRRWTLSVSFRPLTGSMHEREYNQCRSPSPWLFARPNDRPWLPRLRIVYFERVRSMAR